MRYTFRFTIIRFETKIYQLVKAVIIAAVYSPEANRQVVDIMDRLGPTVSRPIALCIEQTIELNKRMSNTLATQSMLSPSKNLYSSRDFELQDEQQLIEAFEQITKLELEKENLNLSLEETRRQKTALQAGLQKLAHQLESSKSQESHDKTVEKLLRTSEYDRDHITSLERELNELKEQNTNQVKRLDNLLDTQEEKRKLGEENQRLQAERDELTQKANKNDNLARKIVALQETVKSSEAIRQEHEAAQEELRSLRRLRERYFEMQKVNEESLKLIQDSEQEIHEELASRQRLEQEVQKLSESLETARDQRQSDVDRLQDVIRELEAGHVQGPLSNLMSLDDELEIDESEEDL